jgi:hypothetical protein
MVTKNVTTKVDGLFLRFEQLMIPIALIGLDTG